jgi:methionyl-tRNA synthetase
MLGFIRQGLEDISISRETFHWGIPFPIRADGSSSQLPDGSWDPAAGVIYVWFDALINYITGAGFPDDPTSFAKWWPADLHVVGKDINRFHTVIWPAMLMSAGLPLPRKVWVHGWLLTQGERMSKSRGNFLEPADVVNAFGQDGARYVTLREVAFDKDTEVSWDSFLRRYNADLANDLGNLINRSISMTNRYLDGERPRPAPGGTLAEVWPEVLAGYAGNIERYLLHEALATLWRFVSAANRYVDAQRPWVLAKAAKAGDTAAAETLRDVLGELLEACRVIGLTVRILAQLGHGFPYGGDGNGGPPVQALAAWGAAAGEPGSVQAAEPIFPRRDTDPD